MLAWGFPQRRFVAFGHAIARLSRLIRRYLFPVNNPSFHFPAFPTRQSCKGFRSPNLPYKSFHFFIFYGLPRPCNGSPSPATRIYACHTGGTAANRSALPVFSFANATTRAICRIIVKARNNHAPEHHFLPSLHSSRTLFLPFQAHSPSYRYHPQLFLQTAAVSAF